jgi:hypothetical protein
MDAADRRLFLMILLTSLLGLADPRPAFSRDGGGNSGPGGGGGGNSGPGGGGGDNSGHGGGDGDNSGHGGGDDDNSGPGGDGDDDDDDDDDDREEARKAVSEGKAAPLRELLRIIKHSHPGEVIDVRLKRRGKSLFYRVKMIDSQNRIVTINIDAVTKRILPSGGL